MNAGNDGTSSTNWAVPHLVFLDDGGRFVDGGPGSSRIDPVDEDEPTEPGREAERPRVEQLFLRDNGAFAHDGPDLEHTWGREGKTRMTHA